MLLSSKKYLKFNDPNEKHILLTHSARKSPISFTSLEKKSLTNTFLLATCIATLFNLKEMFFDVYILEVLASLDIVPLCNTFK